MKTRLFLLCCALLAWQRAYADEAMQLSTAPEKPKVRLQMEVVPTEVEPLGLKVKALETDLMTRLIQSGVLVQENPVNPLLMLRIKTIESGGGWSTFIQLAFFEEAELTRNRTKTLAMTWSQASLLATSRDDFSSEVTKTVLGMAEAFAKDYQKAVLPAPAPTSTPALQSNATEQQAN